MRRNDSAMKVLLKEDVDNLGYAGEVMDVANGYGRNYLLPRGLAVQATPGVLKQAESWRDRAAARVAELRKEHEALASRINGAHLVFTAKAGETGKLYGSVTTGDIVEQLNETLGTDVDRRSVVSGPLRQLGEHKVMVRLSRDYQPHVTVFIHPEGSDESDDVEGEEVSAVEVSELDAVEADDEEIEALEEITMVEEQEATDELLVVDEEA
jgi:large subunit ribosomal protein L9